MSHSDSGRVSKGVRQTFADQVGVSAGTEPAGASLSDLRETVPSPDSTDLAPIGRTIQSDLTRAIDSELISKYQSEVARTTTELPTVLAKGLPDDGPYTEFAAVSQAAQPIYDHLANIGFFESTEEHLPEFSLEMLTTSVQTLIRSTTLSQPLAELGMANREGVDLLATVVGNGEELVNYHWVVDGDIPREELNYPEAVPPVTQGVAGGVLIWLDDLDQHLWTYNRLITDEIFADAVWHGRSMAAGFYLMSEAARVISEDPGHLAEDELGALLTTSFAVQAIAQGRLPQDVYWITEKMRTPRNRGESQ